MNIVIYFQYFFSPVDASEDTTAINPVGSVMPATGTVAGNVVQLLVKRQAPTGCLLYRYGTFATNLDIIRKSSK